MKTKTDAKDEKILKVLIQNSRLSHRAIARKAGVSVVTAINRIRNMQNSGIIKKHTVQLDYEKLGYDLNVLVFVRVSKGRLFEVEKRISLHPSVYAVYDITGPFDVLVLARFRSRAELDSFIKKIQTYEYVERTETNLVLNQVKNSTAEI